MRREARSGAEHYRSGHGWRLVHAALLTVVVVVAWWTLDNPWLFSGSPLARLHPVIVHLPIAFLLLAPLLAVLSMFEPLRSLATAVELVIALGLWSSSLALMTGGALARSGAYEAQVLDDHRWWASALLLAGLVAYWIWRCSDYGGFPWMVSFCWIGIVLLVVLTGHSGGSLTHGSDYLSHLIPAGISEWIDPAGADADRRLGGDIRTARLLEDLILPILEERCVECHGNSRKEGELSLATAAAMLSGGEAGKVIEPGNPEQSELIRRIELPRYHDQRMPPGARPPLSVGSAELIRWWVASGADPEIIVDDLDTSSLPSSVRTTLGQMQVRPPAYGPVGLTEVEAPDANVIERLRQLGMEISPVAQGEGWLEVSFARGRGPISGETLEHIRPIAANIIWLDLSSRELPEGGLRVVRNCLNLRKLKLSFTNISDADLDHLSDLAGLETLNLVGTDVGDQGLRSLRGMDRLRKLYVWQTAVTKEGAEQLQRTSSRLEVNLGVSSPSTDNPPG